MPFDAEWTRLEPLLRAAWAEAPQLWSLEAIRDRAARRDGVYFWPGERSVIVGELLRGDLHTAFNFWLGAGERRELFGMARRIEAWATDVHGASLFMVQGRRGWGRYAASQGYRRMSDLFVKGASASVRHHGNDGGDGQQEEDGAADQQHAANQGHL